MAAIAAKGAPFQNLSGFVDGKFVECARPLSAERSVNAGPNHVDQGDVYSGYQKGHGATFLAVMLPIGILVMYGPYAGAIFRTQALHLGLIFCGD